MSLSPATPEGGAPMNGNTDYIGISTMSNEEGTVQEHSLSEVIRALDRADQRLIALEKICYDVATRVHKLDARMTSISARVDQIDFTLTRVENVCMDTNTRLVEVGDQMATLERAAQRLLRFEDEVRDVAALRQHFT
ncbi:MAG: hypothetical protein Q9191_007699, partial [Dirinaria sp. TL-2023a]